MQSLCAPLGPFRSELKKVLPQPFTPGREEQTYNIVDVHPYRNILLPRYRCHKNCQFVAVVPKTEDSVIIFAHQITIKLYKL